MNFQHTFFIVACLVSTVLCTCSNPQVQQKTYVTEDATVVTEVGVVVEFSFKCSDGSLPKTLYAEANGIITPVARTDDNNFQVSWTEDIKKASSGSRTIRVFDEERYSTLKKILRTGEDSTKAESLTNIDIYVPSVFTGPWLKSEFIAAVLSVAVVYVALSSKYKLLE